jgi:Zn-dependent M28 family amino/carboxypeptidase
LAGDIGDRNTQSFEGLERARDYIAAQFRGAGYAPRLEPFEADGRTVENVIVEKKGLSRPDEIVLVGAHYDTCFNPGADDNASGVAGLLELARSFESKNPARTVRFVAFVNEEPPFFRTELMGSRVHAKGARERGEKIAVMIALEMIGYYTDRPFSQKYPPLLGLFYPNRGNFIAFVGDFASLGRLSRAKKAFRGASTFPVRILAAPHALPGVDFSDHASFWKENYPAFMVTDTAFYRYPHYHSFKDTPDRLDYPSMAEVVLGLEAVLLEFAGSKPPDPVMIPGKS